MTLLKIGLVSLMSGKIHDWNIFIVDNHDFPRSIGKEFQVASPTLLGATMKANRIIKKDYIDWTIQRVWWLNPNTSKKD